MSCASSTPMLSRVPTFFLITAAISSSVFAEMRPWKRADGLKSVQGEFVHRNAATVTIRLETGKEFTLEISKLHADDAKWLETNHTLNPPKPSEPEETKPDPAAVFDTLVFGDHRDVVLKKLKTSKVVEMTMDETFIGRSGMNGIFYTRQPIGKVKASLYFEWNDDDRLKELTLQTDLLPDTEYKSELEPTWAAFVELMSSIYGKPAQRGPLPAMASLADGTFSPSHLWNLDSGGAALLGTARDAKRYQLVVRFTQKKIQPVQIR